MAADYDRLFEAPEGIDLPDEATAQPGFDVDAPAATPMPPLPTGPPRTNGHVAPPMPVDVAEPFPSALPEPSPARPPMPVDANQQPRSAVPRPPMPVDLPTQPPPQPPAAPVDPAPAPVDPPTPARAQPPTAPVQRARHARRAPDDPPPPRQPGRGTASKHSHRADARNGRPVGEIGLPGPPRPRADPPPPRPNGRSVRVPERAASQFPPAGDGAAKRDVSPPATTAPQIAAPGAKSAVAHIRVKGVKPTGKSAPVMVARRGWRRWVHRLTGLNPGLSRDERYELDLADRIRRNPRGSYAIGVLGLKGGVGKTTVTVALGSVLAQVRRDRILALDADAGSGNLADRVGRQTPATIAHLLADDELTHHNDIRTYTSANGVNLEVLAAEDYSTARRGLSEADWQSAAVAVSRFYNIVLADCGAGFFDPATRGVLSTLSGVVVVASASIDAVRQTAIAIDWLRDNGFQELLRRGCVVINHVAPGEPNIAIADLLREFGRFVPPGRVVVLPWDNHIATGKEIELDRLGPVYRRRITELAAALSDDFDRGERR